MLVLGWTLVAAAVVMLIASGALIIRSSPDRRVSLWPRGSQAPKHSGWTRLVGLCLYVPGAILVGIANPILVIQVLIVGLAGFPGIVYFHNERLKLEQR